MSTAADQGRYQVRLDWGASGLCRLAPAEVVVVVDVLEGSEAEAIASAAEAEVVLRGSLRTAATVARAVVAEQTRRGARVAVAVIAAGSGEADGTLRFAVEDLLGAGAIVDALAAVGIDHSSPEAAAACEAFRGLRGALRHLLTAGATGQALLAQGRRDEVLAAAELDVGAPAVVQGGTSSPPATGRRSPIL